MIGVVQKIKINMKKMYSKKIYRTNKLMHKISFDIYHIIEKSKNEK